MNIHAPGGIRTYNPSKWAAADPHRRPRGQWDRQFNFKVGLNEWNWSKKYCSCYSSDNWHLQEIKWSFPFAPKRISWFQTLHFWQQIQSHFFRFSTTVVQETKATPVIVCWQLVTLNTPSALVHMSLPRSLVFSPQPPTSKDIYQFEFLPDLFRSEVRWP